MTKLEAKARELAKAFGEECDAGPTNTRQLAEAITQLAREFAADALRQVGYVKQRQVWLSEATQFVANAKLPMVDGLNGLGFNDRDEAEAWLTKSIAAAIKAAEGEE